MAVAEAEYGPVAAGMHQPVEGVTEVVGVATLPAVRRQGLGGAVTGALVEDALARGVETVFLSAGSEDIARVYGRLGFRRVATACVVGEAASARPRRLGGSGARPASAATLNERPVVAGVLGALVIAFSAILVDLADVAPATAAFWRCAYALPLLGVLAWAEDRRFGPRTWRERRLALAAGVLFAIDMVVWHYAIRDVGAGLATVLGNLQVVIVPFVALAVLGERVPRAILYALPLVCTGVLLVSGALEDGAYGANPGRGVLFGVATGLAYAAFLLVQRQGSMDLRRPAGALFDMSLVAALVTLAFGLAIGVDDLAPAWPSAFWLVTLALTSQVLGWLLITVSLPRLPAAMTSMILTLQPVASVALGAILLGQEPSVLQLCGVALILSGLVSVAIRPRRIAGA